MRAIALRLLVALTVAFGVATTAGSQTKPAPKAAQRARPAKVEPLPPPPPPPKEREVRTSDEVKRESLKGAATTPLRDLNVVRTKIPEVLLAAMADPYARPPRNYRCPQLIAIIQPLEDVLGTDIDRILI